MKELKLSSTDNKNQLHVYVWEPDKEKYEKPRAILQLSHGMTEHLRRYNDFSEYLSRQGFVVIGNDHLGHGLTAKEEDYGYFGANKSETVVNDLYEVTKYAKSTYGSDIPFFLFGHSMGSFMARRYIMTYGKELTGVIISGTGSQPKPILASGILLANIVGLIKGERYVPGILKSIAFGAYNKKISNPESEHAWLTKDKEIVKIYDTDKMCTFDFTVNGYKTLFGVIDFIQKDKNIAEIPKNLPIILVSGTDDPVGDYGKGVRFVYEKYKSVGIKDIDIILYDNCRHELLNEIEREKVYSDILNWLNDHMK